jgi:TatA/E family protein of Tat protein translocase
LLQIPILSFLDTQTVLVLVLVVALLFGSTRLPKLARSLREARDEFEKGSDEPEKKPESAPPPAAQTPPPTPPTDNPPSQ